MTAAEGQGGECVEARAFFHLADVAAGAAGGKGPWCISLDDLAREAGQPTVRAIADHLGIACEPLGMAMVNGSKAELESVVRPGDRVAFFPDYVPYHRVYGACVV